MFTFVSFAASPALMPVPLQRQTDLQTDSSPKSALVAAADAEERPNMMIRFSQTTGTVLAVLVLLVGLGLSLTALFLMQAVDERNLQDELISQAADVAALVTGEVSVALKQVYTVVDLFSSFGPDEVAGGSFTGRAFDAYYESMFYDHVSPCKSVIPESMFYPLLDLVYVFLLILPSTDCAMQLIIL
jgi:hypothetical protein